MKRVRRIAKNHVEVMSTKIIQDKDGADVEIWSDVVEDYGQNRIDVSKPIAEKSLVDANAFDEKKYKQDMIQDAQDEITLLADIQKEMDKR